MGSDVVQMKADAAQALDTNAVVLRQAVLRAIDRGDALHDLAAATAICVDADGSRYVLETAVTFRKMPGG